MEAGMAMPWWPVDARRCRPALGGMHVSWNDTRVWYAVAAAVVVLLIIAYIAGWFGGAGATLPAATPY